MGDAVYMVAGGVPDRSPKHAENVAGLALEIQQKSKELVHTLGQNKITTRIGKIYIPAGKGHNNIWARGYKTFSMLNSVEHEILNAHKYENIKKFSFFQTQMSLECYFPC